RDAQGLPLPQAHDGPFAELPLDLGERSVDRLHTVCLRICHGILRSLKARVAGGLFASSVLAEGGGRGWAAFRYPILEDVNAAVNRSLSFQIGSPGGDILN